MSRNAVIMPIFQIKIINLSQKRNNKPCRFFFLFFLKNAKKLCWTTLNKEKNGGWPSNIGIKLPQSIKV